MMVLFGNATPVEATPGLGDATESTVIRRRWQEGDTIPAAVGITLFDIPDSDSIIDEVLPTVTRTWASGHSSEPPVWVASTNPTLAQMLSSNYGCPIEDVDGAMVQYQVVENTPSQEPATEEPATEASESNGGPA